MDSRVPLDYALFQLTPTRTRCDLVVFAGGKNEKIASGLLEPFVSHLKYAKDQISKGGYSVTLRPTSSDASSWFTKATLERFVRFVNTPEVLERFVTTEREINQIESSIESEVQGTASITDGDPKSPIIQPKSKADSNGGGDAEAEENPKIRLQRVLESRKAMLKKEQAMAYARALVAGFEMDYIYDLVSFSDAFGALRLREACVNFLELCHKKNGDRSWMDEVAAMQASYFGTSAIVGGENSIIRHGSSDTNEDNGLPLEFNLQQTEAAAPLPTWPHNHLPPYMQNPQAPFLQQIPPYPGYIFPPHYPGNMQWPSNFQDPSTYLDRDINDSKKHKHSKKKKEKQANGSHSSDNSGSTTSDSSDEQEQIHTKKHKKKASRKVVIRNINYITSSRNEEDASSSDSEDSSNGEEYADGDSIKKKKQHKTTSRENKKAGTRSNTVLENSKHEEKKDGGNWDIFQNILMRDAESADTSSKTIHVQEENFSPLDKNMDKPNYASDDFLFKERSNSGNGVEKFEGGENFHGVVKRSGRDEELLIPPRAEGEYYVRNVRFGNESSIIKTRNEEDWIMGSKRERAANPVDQSIFSGDQASTNRFQNGVNKRVVYSDDSFMVQARTSDGPQETEPKTDIFVVSDIVGANDQSKNQEKVESYNNFNEPEDLYMMRGRDSAAEQIVPSSWNPEMDYVNNNLIVEKNVKSQSKTKPSDNASARNAKTSKEGGKKLGGKETKSKAVSGSPGRTKSDVATRSKMSGGGNTTSRNRAEKEEEKRKKMEELLKQRQKRIAERSAAKGGISETPKRTPKEIKKTPTSTKTDKSKPKLSTDENKKPKPVMRSSTIDRLSASRTTNKQLSNGTTNNAKGTASKAKGTTTNTTAASGSLKKTKGTTNKAKSTTTTTAAAAAATTASNVQETKSTAPSASAEGKNAIEDFGDVKELHTVTSVEKKEDTSKNLVRVVSNEDDDLPPSNPTVVITSPAIEVTPTIGSNLRKSNDEKPVERKKLTFSPEISVVSFSTTPPHDDEKSEEQIHSRKKWSNGEGSPKAPKGFRRLLFFGRRS